MNIHIGRLFAIAICVFACFGSVRTLAQNAASLAPRSGGTAAAQEEVLWSFCSKGGSRCTDGEGPGAGVIMDGSGHLYGTTVYGGDGSAEAGPGPGGTVFELTPNAARTNWTETVLYRFCAKPPGVVCRDGSEPSTGLVMDGSGHLYGTDESPANLADLVFELTPNADRTKWTYTVLHRFCTEPNCADGGSPRAGLILDGAGHLYGTTVDGGGALTEGFGFGVVFELTPNAARKKWTETVLYRFCSKANCADGASPYAGLIMDASGHLYGTTQAGGGREVLGGVVFELTPNPARTIWTETVLHSFCADVVGGTCIDGSLPRAGLIMDKSGHLYGTTGMGGAHEQGTVFELTPNPARTKWTETVLHSFSEEQGDGANPKAGLIMDKSGNLYGTAGNVFELTPNAARTEWTETVLYSFCAERGCADGYIPDPGLIMDRSGYLYGTTSAGGAHSGGTVFELKP